MNHPCVSQGEAFSRDLRAPFSPNRPACCSAASPASPPSEGLFCLSDLFHSRETRLGPSLLLPWCPADLKGRGKGGSMVRATSPEFLCFWFLLAVPQPG